ncbi:adenylyltransferase/cytidyltransferase family protein [Ktedonobacter racemifer]|uniref:RfaE bifunctional protein n=1 Tax=Ktedonobacter racemifer DSM 44963 TaxID=485913 RepID=D6TMY8_KTERA|nr:adenylyltransferase/cytidyltransferase family protein [Ktedonobacter racemifer]EFH87138.1 rfaE bifunctional protein [Ktedonobacter racemifer DSM 44963]
MSKEMIETRSKVLSRAQLALEVVRRQEAGERAVFTNGCFDLLHLGHIRYLQEARSLGDFLILGLNSDESVRHLKGPTRPLVPELERAELLAALACIDYVTIFGEPTASELIATLEPAIYVKGGDYAGSVHGVDPEKLPEARIVFGYGGEVSLISYLPGHSTTELIQKIQRL